MGAYLAAPQVAMILALVLFAYYFAFAEARPWTKVLMAVLIVGTYAWECALAGTARTLYATDYGHPAFLVGRVVFGLVLLVATWISNTGSDY